MDEEEGIIENKSNIPQNQGIISESDLLDIYETQYNDIFSKILILSEEKFFALLQEQVLLNLRIINKLSDLTLMSFFQEIINQRYISDKEKVKKGFDIIKALKKNDITYLDCSNCYIHCIQNIEPKHKCGSRLILYEKNIYCLHCNKVYTENQIKLYCSHCNEKFFSKIRDINNDNEYNNINNNEDSEDDSDEDERYLYPAAFGDYHCKNIKIMEKEQIIKCLECGQKLYFNLSKKNENFLICTKCKLIFDSKNIKFKCNFCHKKILSKAKLYNDFSPKINYILFLIHTLYKDKKAFPENFQNKKCKCDYDKLNIKEFKHMNDKGILLFGKINSKQKIICSQCYTVWDREKYKWICSLCNEEFFEEIKIHKSENENKDIKKEENEINDNNDNIIDEEYEIEDKNNISNIDNIKDENFEDIEYEEEEQEEEKNEQIKIVNEEDKKIKENINKDIDKGKGKDKDNKIKDNIEIVEYKKEENINLNKNDININNNINNDSDKKNKSKNKNYDVLENNKTIKIDLPEPNIEKGNNKNQIQNIKNNINTKKYYISKTKTNEALNKKEDNNIYKNLATKVIIDKKTNSNINNNNPNENKNENNLNQKMINNNNNNNNLSKKVEYVHKREKNKSNIYNNRPNHQIVNINETSKNIELKKNNTLIEESQNKEKENKEKNINNININKSKNIDNKKDEKNFTKIQKYFDDFNEEYMKELEIQEELKKKKENEKQLKLKKENNLKIEIKEEQNNKKVINNRKHNIHVIKYVSNKNNNIYTDNNLIKQNEKNNNYNNNVSKEKKEIKIKTNLLSNKLIISQNKKDKIINKDIKENNNNKTSEVSYNNIEVEKNGKSNINNINNINNLNIKNGIYTKKENINTINLNSYNSSYEINSNNYKNIGVLGQGSYGKIYLVEDIYTKEQYAMKKIIVGDELELKDNEDEYNMIMQISSTYPDLNIIHVYGTETKNFDEYNFVFYVLMEVANCDWEKELLNRAKEKAYYTEEEILYILDSLVYTFNYLQQIGISHRDIKPQNILCFGEKGYKISDFGEAKFRKKWRLAQNPEGYTSKQTIRGTELYMSPLLYTALKTAPSDGAIHNVFKSDVFSLGMCFLLAGCLDYKCLYDMRKVKSMNDVKKIVNKYFDKKYSENFENIILNMLNLNEKDRPDFIELSNMIY